VVRSERTPHVPREDVVTPIRPAVETWLLGTWRHVSASDTPDGSQQEIHSDIRWTFEAGGEGTYHQEPMFSRHETERKRSWKLEGDTIVIGPTRDTIVSRDTDREVWKNERQGNDQHVERVP
jgi:hypothetical protein